ncbi:MAG: hypothetical protein P8Y36_06525, partial [Alphaproteobacteria bacterium]
GQADGGDPSRCGPDVAVVKEHGNSEQTIYTRRGSSGAFASGLKGELEFSVKGPVAGVVGN